MKYIWCYGESIVSLYGENVDKITQILNMQAISWILWGFINIYKKELSINGFLSIRKKKGLLLGMKLKQKGNYLFRIINVKRKMTYLKY